MLQRASFFVAAAAAFGLSGLADDLGPVPGAFLMVVSAIALALCASATLNAVSVASGALGAFAGGVLLSASAALAGAVLVAFCFAERTWRVRGAMAKIGHVATAFAAGATAGGLTAAYGQDDLLLRIVVVVIAAVLVALPLWIEADDPIAHALDLHARSVSEPAKSKLREGAELRRTTDPTLLDRATAHGVGATWRNLLVLAQARARLEHAKAARIAFAAVRTGVEPTMVPRVPGVEARCDGASCADVADGPSDAASDERGPATKRVPEMPSSNAPASPSRTALWAPRSHRHAVIARLDARIEAHVATLARAYTAADTAQAAEVSLDDGALRVVETTGESLEQMTEAICEEV